MTEADFDDIISPLLMRAAEETKRLGGAMVCLTKWDEDGEWLNAGCTTRILPDGNPAHILATDMLARSKGNIDGFLIGLARAHREGVIDLSQSMLMLWMKLPPFGSKKLEGK